MSAVPSFPAGSMLTGLRLSADGFFALGETPERYELIDGVVVMSPSPTPQHQSLVSRLFAWIDDYLEQAGEGRAYPDTDVRFDSQRVYRPDVCVFASDSRNDVRSRLEGAPDLIIEVLSPHSRPLDLVTKRQDYERFGVREYWVIDPADASVRCWDRRDNALMERTASDLRVTSEVLQGFTLDLGVLRRACGR